MNVRDCFEIAAEPSQLVHKGSIHLQGQHLKGTLIAAQAMQEYVFSVPAKALTFDVAYTIDHSLVDC